MLANMPPVNGKVKGLLKGLRYISQIFDENEKEEEMVIGRPTDVKHVAHIGWDGPAVTNPSWMTEFHSAPLSTTFGNEGASGSPKSASQEIPMGGIPPSPSRDEPTSPSKPRRTRRHASTESAGSESPARERGTRHSRKHQSTGSAPGSESPARDGDSRRGRRHHKSEKSERSERGEKSDIGSGCESPAQELPPKQKKKERRSKGSTDGGSNRSSHRSKEQDSGVEERAPAPARAAEE